ncbi:transposase [Dehalobacter sp. TeCB1]|nr:transposase [Dehalobacter sp. TeCB1]
MYKVCVDDFAFKKRHSYGTIMVDIETHRIIDLLDSRDKEPVTQWLKSFPNLKVVSRDGSHTYSSAISEAHPNAIQISDRFHLLKNLSEAVEKYMLRLFPARLEIPATEINRSPEMQALLDTRNRAQRIRFTKEKYREGFSVSEIALIMHASISTIGRYLAIKDEDIPKDTKSARERQHNEAINKMDQKIATVRKLHEQGCSIEEIIRVTGYIRNTITRYLSKDCSNVNGHYDCRRPGKLQPYEKEILELRSKGMTYTKITEILRKKGYDGSVDALRVFMQKEREHQKRAETENREHKEYIARKWMVQLIYRDIEKVKGITQKQYEAVIKKYPILGNAYQMLHQFHALVFSKKVDELESWISETEKMDIAEVKSYLTGLRKDLVAVKNSIIYPYNNGLAEGSVNKLKIVKRIMYGRNSFELLKSKTLLLESLH